MEPHQVNVYFVNKSHLESMAVTHLSITLMFAEENETLSHTYNAGKLLRKLLYCIAFENTTVRFLVWSINNYWKLTLFGAAAAAVATHIKNPIIFMTLFSCKNIKSLFSALASTTLFDFHSSANVTIAPVYTDLCPFNDEIFLAHIYRDTRTHTHQKSSFENDGVRCRCVMCVSFLFNSKMLIGERAERVW